MNPFTFLLPLVSVLVGLSVTDVARSVHLLLRARHRVRWDPLPLAAAFLAVLATFNLWWRLFAEADASPYLTLGGFLPLAAQLLVLYLLNAAALPDEVPADGLDLRAFYDVNGRSFWALFAVHVLLLMAVRTSYYAAGRMGGGEFAGRTGLNVAVLVLFAVLIAVRARTLHAVALAALVVLAFTGWSGLSLAMHAAP